MTISQNWQPFEGNVQQIRQRFSSPLLALAEGQVPALVIREAYSPSHCKSLINRFYQQGLLYDPHQTTHLHRVDIGTSFGTHRADKEKFFTHAEQTRALFNSLFQGYDNPVEIMYQTLAQLVVGKEVKTAHEANGKLYGPAIFRTYYAGLGHGPHYDSVAKRTKAFDYQISRFEYQFAGVLCFQNSDQDGENGEPFLYNCPWTPNVQEKLNNQQFRHYACEQGIDRVQIDLAPGDLYFFFSENIHEVPSITGNQPRIVLAIFFAMSPDDNEIYVWS